MLLWLMLLLGGWNMHSRHTSKCGKDEGVWAKGHGRGDCQVQRWHGGIM